MKKRLVMIGNGMAGIRCIEEILKLDSGLYDITIFGDEPHPNYNRIMLSHVLQGKTNIQDIIMNEYSWYEENDITLYTNEKVINIDREEQVIITEKNRIVIYDKLIIATGSSAFILPVEGSQLPGVTGFRTIEDTQFMLDAAKRYKKAVVIGGGLLGLEAARGLIDLGMDVHVVHLMPYLMEQQLDAKAASLLREDLESQGMKFLMEKKTVKILGTDRVEGIQFEDGDVVTCDLIVMAVGIRPNTHLAKDASLIVNRGIVTNDYMQTDDESVYAVGECAEHDGIAYGLVAPLYEQGTALAKHITNSQTDGYAGSIVGTQLKVAGCDLFSAGQIYEDDVTKAISIFNECTRSYKKVLIRDNKVVGVVLYGDTAEGTRLFSMLKKEEDIQEYTPVSLLHKAGEESGLDVASMSANDTVCGCNGVTKGTIVHAILEQDLTTFEEVKGCTKAAGSCGKCRPVVEQILSHTLGDSFDASAQSVGICGCTTLSRDEVVTAIHEKGLKSPKEVRNVLGFAHEDGCSKCRPALNYYLRMTRPEEYADDKSSRFVNERMNGNIQHDGTFSVIPRMYGGVTTADDLMKIAEVAKRYDVPLVKITGASRIGLYGVKKEDLPKVWADLDMTSGYAYSKSLRNVKSCVGSRFCRFGTKDSLGLGMLLEQSLEMVDTPHKMKMGVTGCPRNCAEALTKDFGVVCVENGFQLYIGGNGGTEVREADFVMIVPTEEDVLRIATAYVQHYRETGIYGERTAPWVERMGLAHIKEVLQDESMVTMLNERFQKARNTYEEAWGQALETRSLKAMYEVETVK
ncbi:nitrite reductase large subunit NirB [Bacillus pseudomycoides]|uniref:nitrite reductase large subunit NirB n=1 Tax=Bacillus pseudomycoides TaxID=64104 RepID=UPI000BF20EFA|nr:nitrite reductase large subunit NirB [Bacillus pseudomycoides]PEI52028.1 nitrite reductase large subunit [Bacillus pseudomycoides]PEJ32057.1 nitrite reductase large subunit [Bacillus pseudomycoides]PEM40404.1 nitrite reductase large subunit [Bacillus pseudomycoides]PGA70784.1 nitrite reductase large subunit [Bacillus pseudomycoides]PHA87202.1 nitrite reductase large subunit [Bacillus pseudomycoides]